jgi:transposase
MYKLNFKKRVWIVRQVSQGESINDVALAQKVSRISVFKIMKTYNEFGFDGLKDHKTGRPDTTLNQNAEIIIFDLRKRFGYGPERIEYLLKSKGFGISHRQIYKLLLSQILKNKSLENGLDMNYQIQMIYGILIGLMILLHKNNLVFISTIKLG